MKFKAMFSSWQKLSTKIVGALLLMLVLALSAIGCTLFLSWQLEGSSAAINETGRLRMQTYRLTLLLASDAREQARQQVLLIDETLAKIGHGDPQRPLFLPPSTAIKSEFERIGTAWRGALRPAALAADSTARARQFEHDADTFVGQVDQLVRLIEQIANSAPSAARLAADPRRHGRHRHGQHDLPDVHADHRTGHAAAPGHAAHEGRDFSVRLAVESNDEFGQLASGFNQMADRLQALYGNLEEGVRSKTATLEYRNRELALLYESAAFLQRPQPLEDICGGFMQRIVDYFEADGSTVRVLDAERGNLHMVVHTGLSEELVASEHCLKVGDCLCGTAVEMKVAKVHDMRRIDKAHELRCHREGFATISIFHIHMRTNSTWASSTCISAMRACFPRASWLCWKPWASCWASRWKTCAWPRANAKWPFPKSATWWRRGCMTASRKASISSTCRCRCSTTPCATRVSTRWRASCRPCMRA